MAVGQENKGKKKAFHDFFRMTEKRKAQADNSEFLTDESPNAAKHWGSECQKVEVQEALLPLNRRSDYCRSPHSFRVTPAGR